MKRVWAVLVAFAFLAPPVFVSAQQATTPSPPPHKHPSGPSDKVDKDRDARVEKIRAEIKAMDARLDEKVAAMNAAKGDQKVEAMAAVINELVSQRKEMRQHLGPVHHGMESPMMGQQPGTPPACPVMKHRDGKQSDAPKQEGAQ